MKHKLLIAAMVAFSTGCTTVANTLNPFYEPPTANALLGDRNDSALIGSGGSTGESAARAALDATASYQRAHAPQPYNPVIQPAVVRLMWIPDHLNKSGDLVPAHYYYVKVLKDRWAVTDAFELESQLGSGVGDTSSLPYIVDTGR